MKKTFYLIFTFFLFSTLAFSDNHKTNFKDIKGYKKQFLSMSEKKVNRIKEVKASDGFPVYEGKTSIQVTVNREDAGCGKGKAQTTPSKPLSMVKLKMETILPSSLFTWNPLVTVHPSAPGVTSAQR